MNIYTDSFHNTAIIEQVKISPYYGAKKIKSYRLICSDSDGFVYFVSVYEKMVEAKKKLSELSAGTFSLVKNRRIKK